MALTGCGGYLSPSILNGQLVIGSNVYSFTFSYFQFPFGFTFPYSSISTWLPSYYFNDNFTNCDQSPASRYCTSINPSSILAAGADK